MTLLRICTARVGPLVILLGLASIGFARLLAQPGGLIVDGETPSLDHARAAGTRTVGNDLTRLFLPHHLKIAEAVARTGKVPGWDPTGFGGRPLVGNPQSGLWYPPVWVAWWCGSPSALGWLTVAHLVWGGLGAYRLARGLGMPPWASVVAGGCFQMSPYLLAQTFEGHYPHVWSASWYPWAFLAALVLRQGDLRGAIALPPVLAMAFLTGHPQEAYYLVLCLGLWAGCESLARLHRDLRGGLGGGVLPSRIGWPLVGRVKHAEAWQVEGFGVLHTPYEDAPGEKRVSRACKAHPTGSPGYGHAWRNAIVPIAVAGAIVGITFGSLAVEWLPVAKAQAWGLKSATHSVGGASRYGVGFENLPQLLGPRALGGPADYLGEANYWESLLAFGGLPFVLSIVGLFRSHRRVATNVWAALAGLTVVFAAGRGLGLFTLLYTFVPGMDRFRVPGRALFLSSLGMAILAGFGVEAIGRLRVGWSRWATWAQWMATVLGVAVLACLITRRAEVLSRFSNEVPTWVQAGCNLVGDPLVWLTLAAPTIAFGHLRRRPSDRRCVATLLGALALAELATHAVVLIRVTPPGRFLDGGSLGEAIARVKPAGPFRIRARDAFLGDLRAYGLGLEKTNLDDAFQIQHAADLYEALYPIFDPPRVVELLDPLSAPLRRRVSQAVLDRMGVALLVSDRPDPQASWPVVAAGKDSGNSFLVYGNPTAMPRAYVVPSAWPAPDNASTVGLMPWVDPREAVLMAHDPLGDSLSGPRQRFTPAEYQEIGPDQIAVRVTNEAPGLLVVADTWIPGWSATLDGHPAPILRGNHAQRVIPLPHAGRHRVEMRYEPPGLAAGLAVTVASSLAWLVVSAVVLARGRGQTQP